MRPVDGSGDDVATRLAGLTAFPCDSCYRAHQPSSGGTVSRSVDRFVSARLGLGGWDVPWFVVVPD